MTDTCTENAISVLVAQLSNLIHTLCSLSQQDRHMASGTGDGDTLKFHCKDRIPQLGQIADFSMGAAKQLCSMTDTITVKACSSAS